MAALSYSELEKGSRIIYNNKPCEIIEANSIFKGRGHSTLRVRLRDFTTGEIIPETFHPSDSFKEADISKIKVKFIYSNKGEYIFSKADNPSARFTLTENQIGASAKFLKQNEVVEGIIFNEEIINISIPIKVFLEVKEAPPGIRGDRAQGGNKIVTLETGAEINVPLFIEEGDVIEVNTEKEEYVRRV